MKLFLVLGPTWIFEIIGHLAGGAEEIWYFPDVLNMLQGVFVFIMAVCNRKVLHTILGKKAERITSGKINMKTLVKRSKSRDPAAANSNSRNSNSTPSTSRPSVSLTKDTDLQTETQDAHMP